MAKNANLRAADKAQNDEFYTQYADIQKEVNAYIEYNPDVCIARSGESVEQGENSYERRGRESY